MAKIHSTFHATVAAALFSLCTGAHAQSTAEPTAPPEAVAAVYILLFADNASSQQADAIAFCIGTGTGADLADPTPAVLVSLSGVQQVRSASDCAVEGSGSAVVLKDSGGNALLFGVEPTECESDTECMFLGSYYEGNLSSQTNMYAARKNDGVWRAELIELGPIASTDASTKNAQ